MPTKKDEKGLKTTILVQSRNKADDSLFELSACLFEKWARY